MMRNSCSTVFKAIRSNIVKRHKTRLYHSLLTKVFEAVIDLFFPEILLHFHQSQFGEAVGNNVRTAMVIASKHSKAWFPFDLNMIVKSSNSNRFWPNVVTIYSNTLTQSGSGLQHKRKFSETLLQRA